MAYQSQVSVWQVHFSFQCYVDLEKLTQKFGSMSPIVNCNPRREEITCRKLLLHRLQKVLGTITTSGCQSEQTWDSLSESKPRVKIEWKFSQRWQAQCMAVYWSKTVKTEVTECLPLVKIPSPPPKITENQVNKPEVGFFFIYYHWAILWYACPGVYQNEVGIRIFLIAQKLQNNFPNISVKCQQETKTTWSIFISVRAKKF